uniref:Uncharacterized protein n=1 Tax=Timema douglasi TaxID=61478 RepID=A0A7R8VUH1_TIMDO|nr:unnamed protein product [Timema douglasi]
MACWSVVGWETTLAPRGDMTVVSGKLLNIYTTARVCRRHGEPCYSGEPDLERLIKRSRDPAELLWAWQEWRRVVGPSSKPLFTTLVDLQNQVATNNGYDSASVMKGSFKGAQALFKQLATCSLPFAFLKSSVRVSVAPRDELLVLAAVLEGEPGVEEALFDLEGLQSSDTECTRIRKVLYDAARPGFEDDDIQKKLIENYVSQDSFIRLLKKPEGEIPPAREEVKERLIEIARGRLEGAAVRRGTGQKPSAKPYEVGDQVLLKEAPVSDFWSRETKKLFLPYSGPFEIIGIRRSNAYVLFDPGTQQARGVFNSESLKPWKPDV